MSSIVQPTGDDQKDVSFVVNRQRVPSNPLFFRFDWLMAHSLKKMSAVKSTESPADDKLNGTEKVNEKGRNIFIVFCGDQQELEIAFPTYEGAKRYLIRQYQEISKDRQIKELSKKEVDELLSNDDKFKEWLDSAWSRADYKIIEVWLSDE